MASYYSKDTQFYHITGPGLIQGKYAVPRLTYYNSVLFNSSGAPVVDGQVNPQANYPGNYIFGILIETDGPDEVIAAVYNRSTKGELPNPDILFHQTSSATRVAAGLGVSAAELALIWYGPAVRGVKAVAEAAIPNFLRYAGNARGAVLNFSKKIASWSMKSGRTSAALGRISASQLSKSKNALKAISEGKDILSNSRILLSNSTLSWTNAKAAKFKKIVSNLSKWSSAGVATAVAPTTAQIALSLVPGYFGYEAYLLLLENYTKFLNPYQIRAYYVEGLNNNFSGIVKNLASPLLLLSDLAEQPYLNRHEMPWYTIEISPTKKTPNKLNKNGGLVPIAGGYEDNKELYDSTTIKNKAYNEVKELALDVGDIFVPGSIGDREENITQNSNIHDKFYINFWKPVDFKVVVALIQMLDVQRPLFNRFVKDKSNIENVVKREALSPILDALKNTAQYQTLVALNKYLDLNVKPKQKNIDEIVRTKAKTSVPLDNNNIYANIEQLGREIDVAIEEWDDDSDVANFYLANKLSDLMALSAEADDLEDFRDRLKKDINKIFVSGGVDDNIREGTIFGQFCRNYINIFNTLAKAWPGSSKTSNSVKKKKDKLQKALLTPTPNYAQLADRREAQLAAQRVINVPFKKTAVFEDHADFIRPLSVLDEMRSERAQANPEKEVIMEQTSDPAPIPTDSIDEFTKSLLTMNTQQRNSLKENLLKRKEQNDKKQAKMLQDLKKIQFSPKFILASALTGVKGLFPLKTNNGIIELPEINFESITSILNNSLNTQINRIQSEVLNSMNYVKNAASDVVNAPKAILSNFSSLGIDVPFDSSFINVKSNTYSQIVSRQFDDIKKIINKPEETANKVRTVQQDSIAIIRQYQDSVEEIKNVQTENFKINGYVLAIDRANNLDAGTRLQGISESVNKKISDTIVKTEKVKDNINQNIKGVTAGVSDKVKKATAKVLPSSESKPEVTLGINDTEV